MKNALILGTNGQDGTFLAERLTDKDYHVLGVDIQDSTTLLPCKPNFTYEKLDLCKKAALESLLSRYRPDVVFHVAALHGSAGTLYESIWQDMLLVNMASVQIVLEYMRTEASDAALVYANSAKVFGPAYPQKITEQSEMKFSCLYTITKIGARDLINYYRTRYGTRSSNLFLFNHESERRPADFFIPKVTKILSEALKDSNFKGFVQSLDFECDWGSADEYMDIAIDISEKAAGEDFVLGTGLTWNAREFVDKLFSLWGLDYRNHLLEKVSGIGNAPLKSSYLVMLDKLEKAITRKPKRSIIDVCNMILHDAYGFNATDRGIKL